MIRIAFQGHPGAYADLACRTVYPDAERLPCPSFQDSFIAVREGKADLAMIPVENSQYGRVADIHFLLPEGGLHIIAEHFQPIHHCLLAPRHTRLEQIKTVHSHPQALGQCRDRLYRLGLMPQQHADTAGAAAMVARLNDPTQAALASSMAAELYDLDILARDMQDSPDNTTRFVVLAREAIVPPVGTPDCLTSFVFEVRNIPAALYKSLGGFATCGINLSRLESGMSGGGFASTHFLCDAEGHPEERLMRLALEELDFFAHHVRILGVYPKHPFRKVG